MLDLSSIAFKVETKELDDAVSKLGDLQKAVSNLNKPLNASTVATEKLAQAQAKTAKEQSKAEESANKAAIAQLKLEKATTASANAQAKLASSTIQSTDKVSALQQKLENTYKDLAQGFTKGESSVLNYARTLGIADDALKPIQDQLKQIGKLSSNPFDSAIGSIRSVTKEFEMMNHRSELASKGIILTAKQLKEYSRVADEVSAKVQSQGLDPTKDKGLADYTKGVERLQAKYLGIAASVSEAQQAEKLYQQSLKDSATAQPSADAHVMRFYKQQEQAANSAAKATDYLTREMNRAENALAGLNNEVSISSSNRLLRFKEGLIASGMATDVAAAKYQAYAKVIAETDKKRAAQQKSDEQSRINNLSRGLAPQISDVAVSLYGGMSPMTVLMQQGLQVRDLIQSSGVEAGKLNEVMRKTGADFVSTLTGTFKAVGSMVVGTLQSAGVNVTKFAMDTTGAGLVLENFRCQATLASKDADSLTASLGKAALSFSNFVTSASSALAGGGIAAGIVALVTAIAVIKQLIKEESELSKVLNLNGGRLGINRDAAYSLATTYAGARGDINGFAEAISESAKAGNISSKSLQTVTETAVYMKNVAGVAIADTVKQFSEIGKDPVKALEKLAINLGTVNPEILRSVRNLQDQGKEAEAAEKAINGYSEGLRKAGASIKDDMGYLESFFKTIGSAASSMWDKILNIGREDTLEKQIKDAEEKIRRLSSGEGVFILSDRNVALGIEKARLEGLNKQLDVQTKLNKQKAKNIAIIESDAEVAKLVEQYTEKSDKKKKAIEEVNKVFAKNIQLAKEDGKAVAEIEANRAKVLAGIEEKFKVRTKKDPIESSYDKAIKTFTNDANAATAAQEKYTKAQQDFLNVATSPEWNSYSDEQKQNIVAAAEEAIAREKVVEQIKEQLKAQLELQKVWDKTVKAQTELDNKDFDSLAKSDARLVLLDEELADLTLQKSIYGDLSVEQKKQIEYAKIKRDLTKEIADIELRTSKGDLSSDAALIEKNNALIAAAKKRQNIDQAIILENNKYEYEQRVQLAAGISSSIEAALFEGGQAGSKKLREVIEAELRKPITLFIQAFVQDIFGLNSAGDTMSKAVSAFDKVSSFFSSGGTNNLVSSGLNKLMSNEVGYKLGLADPTGYTTGSGVSYSANSTGSMLSKTAGQIGGAMTAYGLQKTLSGGYKTGESGLVDAATAIGGFFDPTGGLIAGTIGGAVNRAFGRKLTETGIEGTFGGSQGFTGNQYSFEKGGWFRSDRTKTSALDSGIQEGFAGQFNVLRAGIALMSTSLGLGTKSIEDFTYSFKLNLMGLSEAEATKKLSEEFDKVGLALADTIPELKEYQKQGETNLDTLTRLSTSLGTVNSTFELLGFKLEDLSLSGAKAADAIVTAYGSLESFSSKMQAYYDAFYTEDEKKAQVLSSISSALKTAGVDIGDVSELTRDGFRQIVDSLVKTKGAADPAVVALLSVAPAFASVTKSTDEVVAAAKEAADKLAKEVADKIKEAMDAARKATDDAYSSLQKSISKQKELLSSQLIAVETLANNLDSIFNLLKDNVRELYAEVTATSNMQVQQAYAIISNARTTGVLPSQDVLSQAIGTVRGSFDSTNYASKFEADRARLLLANDLAVLQGFANEQLTEAQQQIKLIKDQIEQYDLILEHAETQINELRGINTSVLSITGAIDALTAAIIKEQEAADAAKNPTKKPDDNPFSTGTGGPGNAGPNPTAGRYENSVDYYSGINAIGSYYNSFTGWENPQQQYENIQAMYSQATSLDVSANQISAATGIPVSGIQQVLEDMGLPKLREFAVGTNYVPRDGLAYLHEGEAIVPKAYNPVVNSETSSSDEMQMLRYEVRAVASSTAKLTRIIERVIVGTNEGEALRVKTTV